MPDFNVGYKKAYGHLFPFGIYHLLTAKKKTHLVRTISMGVLKDYRNRGIDLAFYYYSYKNGVPKGYTAAEMSWVEEDNVAMTNTAVEARRQGLPQVPGLREGAVERHRRDLLLLNGIFHTMSIRPLSRRARWPIRAGRFLHVGDEDGARAALGGRPEVVDLGGDASCRV